ncbi:cysteine desulfurase [Anoxybacter fermentans]|uniref:cysteine desulfurase n=1 Tax=Anoxybacter fermentans TaxID=1323375 RepID=A0A3S9T1C0_9FIRM|nr:aminotransferase class V-fold PLP-dependent enzyme [Anoxybacter fermentans]AZR74295.1 cysteine desulfurase [Anoxybacter fermentans]
MIYLDNAATSWPKPEKVYQKMDQFFRKYGANPGRAGHKMAAYAGREIFEVREKLAEFFGAKDSSEIIFTSNATHSLNLGIRGVVEKGDHVITSCLEHNSVIRPLKELERNGIIELSIIGLTESGDLDFDSLKKAIKENTKLIVMTHGSNVTGHIFDIGKIAKLAKEKGVLVMIDAAQTAGILPINLQELPIDMMAFPGHKSLYGPPGTGGLYIRKGIKINPIFAGGTGSKSEELYQPEVWPDKFESGTLNSVGIVGLGAGLDFIKKEGLEQIWEHEYYLTQKFMEGLLSIDKVKVYGPELGKIRTPVVSFNIGEESSSEVGYILDQVFDIAVRSGLHCSPLAHQTIGTFEQGTVRVSFGYFNNIKDVEETLKAIEEIAKEV